MNYLSYLWFGDRLLLACVLMLAGVGKLAAPWTFARTVELVGVPLTWSRPVAYSIIGCELSLGAGFALAWRPIVVSFLTTILFVVFAGVAARVTRTGLTVSCNCFGQSATQLSLGTVVRCTTLAALAVLYGFLSAFSPKLTGVEPGLAAATLFLFLYWISRWVVATREPATAGHV
jgi:hypothetical protein